NLGDLGLHLTYIKTFASGMSLWPDSPIYVYSKLRYPAGIDLFNGILTNLGFDLRPQLAATGLLASLGAFYALYRWCGTFAAAGMGGIYPLRDHAPVSYPHLYCFKYCASGSVFDSAFCQIIAPQTRRRCRSPSRDLHLAYHRSDARRVTSPMALRLDPKCWRTQDGIFLVLAF